MCCQPINTPKRKTNYIWSNPRPLRSFGFYGCLRLFVFGVLFGRVKEIGFLDLSPSVRSVLWRSVDGGIRSVCDTFFCSRGAGGSLLRLIPRIWRWKWTDITPVRPGAKTQSWVLMVVTGRHYSGRREYRNHFRCTLSLNKLVFVNTSKRWIFTIVVKLYVVTKGVNVSTL